MKKEDKLKEVLPERYWEYIDELLEYAKDFYKNKNNWFDYLLYSIVDFDKDPYKNWDFIDIVISSDNWSFAEVVVSTSPDDWEYLPGFSKKDIIFCDTGAIYYIN